MAVLRTHTPPHVSFDDLAVDRHCSAASTTLVNSGRNGETSSFMAEEVKAYYQVLNEGRYPQCLFIP